MAVTNASKQETVEYERQFRRMLADYERENYVAWCEWLDAMPIVLRPIEGDKRLRQHGWDTAPPVWDLTRARPRPE